MPLYEYQCKSCGHRFEKIQSFSAPEEKVCPSCGGEVERLISAPAFQFKGSGWYVNDYAGKALPSKASGESKDTPKDSGKSETKSDSGGKSDSGAASSSTGTGGSSSPSSTSSGTSSSS